MKGTAFSEERRTSLCVPVQNCKGSASALLLSSFREKCCLQFKFNPFCFVLDPVLPRTGPYQPFVHLFPSPCPSSFPSTSTWASVQRGGAQSASLPFRLLSTEKHAQSESYEFSFIWGKMRTIAQETASQVVLRNCSEHRAGVGMEGCSVYV